ncbi:MAG: ABC transporter permease [Verrucomicrobiota bacterium]
MKKSFSLFLSLRYLKPKRTFVSIITLISIVGVMLGVAILVITLAVMTGFEREIKKTFLGFDPHIVLTEDKLRTEMIPGDPVGWDDILAGLEGRPRVVSSSPFVEGQVLTRSDDRSVAPFVRGISPNDVSQLAKLTGLLVENGGEMDLVSDLNGDKAVISRSVAQTLEVQLGDKIDLYSPQNIDEVIDAVKQAEDDPELKGRIGEMVGDMISPVEVTVTGIIDSPMYNVVVIVDIYIAQQIFGLGDEVSGIGLTIDEPYQPILIRDSILPFIPTNWVARTWTELHKTQFDAIRFERQLLSFLLFFIILVAAFCIMNTMITVTVQKRREMGIMKAMGASVWQIVTVFLYQGMLVGLVGTGVGLVFGLLVVKFRNELREFLGQAFGMEIFPEAVYGLSELPAQVVWSDVMVVSVGAFLLCTLAALPPAYFVARMDAARALRND